MYLAKDAAIIDLKRLHRVLIVRLDEIGDLVLFSATLRELRRILPTAFITLVVKESVYNLVEKCPYVNEILPYRAGVYKYFRPFILPFRAWNFARRYLREPGYDIAIMPRYDVDASGAALLIYFSGAMLRVGFPETSTSRKRWLNLGYNLFYNRLLLVDKLAHEVERGLDLVRFLGGVINNKDLEFWTDPEDDKCSAKLFANFKPGQRCVALGIGAGHQKRRWPPEYFSALGAELIKRFRVKVLIIGDSSDFVRANQITRQIGEGAINLTGQFSLRELGAVLRRVMLFVGNESGPMHIAAAVRIPVVAVSCHPLSGDSMHYNSPVRYGPWGTNSRILQPPMSFKKCAKACNCISPGCISKIKPEQVMQAIENVLPVLSFNHL